jgi:hypothetical protein
MIRPSHKSIAAAFSDPSSCGLTLLLSLINAYGGEPFAGGGDPEDEDPEHDGWSPETIAWQVRQDFQATLTPAQLGKLIAAIVVFSEPHRFYSNLRDFMDLANALNGDSYDPGVLDLVSPAEAAWAIYEAMLIEQLIFEPTDDPEAGVPEFDQEIRGYLSKAMDDEGIVNPPDVLRIAEHDPDRMARIAGDFSDDPAMFAAIVEAEDARSRGITLELKARLHRLFQQLARLYETDVPTVFKEFELSPKAADALLD